MTLEEDGFAALAGWTLLTPSTITNGSVATSDNSTSDEENAEEDMELMEVGEITDFIDIPNNPCIEVETINGAVMLPLHEDLILSIYPEYQEIIMQIPEGLL
jgi:hypothetical protein